jgi:hypothetical protein
VIGRSGDGDVPDFGIDNERDLMFLRFRTWLWEGPCRGVCWTVLEDADSPV